MFLFNTLKKSTFYRLFIISFLLLLVFIIINLFFFSLISIGIYKFICYEKQESLLEAFFFFKNTNIFYFSYTSTTLYFVEKIYYFFDIYSFTHLSQINFFFHIFYSTKVLFFLYLKNIELTLQKELNLIFLNFFIRSSNLN